MSCFNSWYTERRDGKALCPVCKASGALIYVLDWWPRAKLHMVIFTITQGVIIGILLHLLAVR